MTAEELSLGKLKHVHIVGVCGTLMGAFAAFLVRRGVQVTGSDQDVYPPMSDVLKAAGVQVSSGYRPENLVAAGRKPDLVVIGNVIRGDNVEARAAIEGGYAYSSLPEAMERLLLRNTRNVVVAGTHGKTTTSSMLAHVLNACGKDPSYFIGGVPADLPYSFHVSSVDAGKIFVLEGDEYDTAFWDKVPKFFHYLPDDAILTSVEYDHADIYPSLEAVESAFNGLLSRIRPGGHLIACTDYPSVSRLIESARRPTDGAVRFAQGVSIATYGAGLGSGPIEGRVHYAPGKIRNAEEQTLFEVMRYQEGKVTAVEELSLRVPGHHNVLNALAVWVECSLRLKMEPASVRAALAGFNGVKRRQETRGEIGGILVIDDFAHHPTAVRETLRALRTRYPKRRLIAVFEPRSATSRRKVFQREYKQAFEEADIIFISKPYDQSRIPSEDKFSSHELVEDLVRSGKSAEVMFSVDRGVADIAGQARPGDVIAVLSNGGFDGFIPKILKALG